MNLPSYPSANRLNVVDELHGHSVLDPYRWLEDADDPATTAWCVAQDELTHTVVSALPGRASFHRHVTDLLSAGSVTVPRWRGDRAFYTRREASQEHPALAVRDSHGNERILVDPLALDPSAMTTLDAWMPNVEGDRIAYQTSRGGNEESQLYVMDVETTELIDGPIDRCRSSAVAWLPGGKEFYYVRRIHPRNVPESERQHHRRVWRHKVGSDAETEDIEVLGAGLDVTNWYELNVSHDGRWLIIRAAQGTAPRDDVWIADLANDGMFVELQRNIDAWLDAWVHGEQLYLFTNRNAPRGRLCVVDPAQPAFDRWRTVVPEDRDATLTDVAVAENGIVLAAHLRDASHTLSWYSPSGQVLGQPTGLGLGSVSSLVSQPEGGRDVWIGYTDFVTPPRVLRCSLDDPDTVITWAEPQGCPDLSRIRVTQAHCRSKDGTAIHAFILAEKEQSDSPRPTILYGYGGFNVSLTPSYMPNALAWVETGGIYVVANLRGGGEYGEDWHRAGMRARKQNVFDDFIAVSEELVRSGLTTAGQLGAWGGSNGGLLVGAALTQRPDLYGAVMCSAPLLDMVRYEKFGLGRLWTDEYGSAAEEEELGWLVSYSPYHRVTEGTSYPAVLLTTFESDSRVDPLHARKMCAALQHASSSDRPVLLRRESKVGHGARAVSRAATVAADQLAFMASHLGLTVT